MIVKNYRLGKWNFVRERPTIKSQEENGIKN